MNPIVGREPAPAFSAPFQRAPWGSVSRGVSPFDWAGSRAAVSLACN